MNDHVIDLTKEKVISLSKATRLLPKRRQGKKPHVSTLYRWAGSGLKGVQLETIQVGGTLCTSREALQRFFQRLGDKNRPSVASPPRRRKSDLDRVEKDLDAAGF